MSERLKTEEGRLTWKIFKVICGLLILALAGGIVTVEIFMFLNHEKVTQAQPLWPTVQATILDSERSRWASEDTDFLSAKYEYEVENINYSGEQTWVVVDARKAYQPGTRVTVYYDPQDHSKSVIEPNQYKNPHGNYVVGMIGAFAVFYLVVIGTENIAEYREPGIRFSC